MREEVLQGAGLGYAIKIYCCPCKGESGNKVEVEEPNIVSRTESQFSSSMPYLEDSTPLNVSPNDSHFSTDDSVFASDSSNNVSNPISSCSPHSKKKYQEYQRETP